MKKLHAIVSNLKLAVEYSETTMKLFDNIKNDFNPDTRIIQSILPSKLDRCNLLREIP
ncbi:hypothetical protein [Flavobacterium davisii]|uniref:hypothetical protein n=1 Tax=Flavobacterium davisii TaxID=2906077 RepID=UPI0013FDD4B3|nr:hypothetical protein [Flavobacterium davisii]